MLRRPGHTEAAVDLAGWPGCARPACCARSSARRTRPAWPAATSCGSSPTSTTWCMISIADLIAYRRRIEKQVERVAEAPVPARARRRSPPSATAARYDDREHVALVYGDIGDGEDVLVRVHSECLTGDVFGSLRCDCGPQLHAALAAVAAGGPRRRALHARARGPRHRPAAQAAGLPAAGPGRGHRRRQPRPRPARRRPRLRHRRADPRRPRHAHDAAADQQPGQARRAGGLRPARSSAGCRCPAHAPPENLALPAHQARPDGPPARHHRAGDRGRAADAAATPCASTSSPHERLGRARRRAGGRRRADPRHRRHPLARRDHRPAAGPRRRGAPRRAASPTRPWSGRPARSSCRSSPRRWPSGTTPWSPSASSSAAARRTSSTSATPSPTG